MDTVGIRELRQNASEVVASAAAGEVILITDRGRPVAQLTPLNLSRLEQLMNAGLARPARGPFSLAPEPVPGPDLSGELARMRAAERY